MATIASMIYSLEAQVSQMTSAMADVKTAVESAESSMLSSIVSGTALGTALEAMGEKALEAFKAAAEAIPEFVEHTIDLGNSIYEMSMKTGASVENLSALRYVASQTGMDFDTLTTSFFKMEASLGATGPKADKLAASLENVGLNLQTLKNESPDEAFIQIVSALENVGNAADRNALAMQLFGKGAKNMAGLFHDDIYAMMDDATSLGLIITTEDAAAAHAADVGWKAFTMQLEAAGMQMADSVLPGLVAIEGLLSGAFQAAVQNTTLKFGDMNSVVKTVLDAILKFGEGAVDVARAVYDGFVAVSPVFALLAKSILSFTNDALQGLKDLAILGAQLPGTAGKDFAQMAVAINALQLGLEQGAVGTEHLTTALQTGQPAADALFKGLKTGLETVRTGLPAAFDTAAAKIADFAKKSHDAAGNVDSDLDGETDKVGKLSEAQKLADSEAMTGYADRLKALVAIEKASAKAYGTLDQIANLVALGEAEQELTAHVYATINSEKDRMKLIEGNTTRQIELTNQITALEDKHAKLVNAAVLTELDAQIKLNAAHGENAAGAILIQDNAWTTLQKSLDRIHAAGVDGITQKAQEQLALETYNKTVLAEAQGDDKATSAILAKTVAVRDQTTALQAQHSLLESFTLTGGGISDKFKGWSHQQLVDAGYINAITDNVTPLGAQAGLGSAGGINVQGFAEGSGGFRDFGTGTLAMLHGIEAVVPQSGSASGASSTTIVINVTTPLGTPQQIADVVGPALIQKLKSAGWRAPSGA